MSEKEQQTVNGKRREKNTLFLGRQSVIEEQNMHSSVQVDHLLLSFPGPPLWVSLHEQCETRVHDPEEQPFP